MIVIHQNAKENSLLNLLGNKKDSDSEVKCLYF